MKKRKMMFLAGLILAAGCAGARRPATIAALTQRPAARREAEKNWLDLQAEPGKDFVGKAVFVSGTPLAASNPVAVRDAKSEWTCVAELEAGQIQKMAQLPLNSLVAEVYGKVLSVDAVKKSVRVKAWASRVEGAE